MRNSQNIPPKCIDPKYLKQSCKKEYIYIYIYIYIERERERESIHLFVWAKYRQNGRERQIFIVKKGGEEKPK